MSTRGQEPTVIVDATTEPISVTELFRQVKVDEGNADQWDEAVLFIGAVRRMLERETSRTFHEKTLEVYLDCWPTCDYIELPRATPLISISAVGYKNTAGTETTTWTGYIADTRRKLGRLVLAYGESWPAETLYPASPIRIRYKAGIVTDSPITEVSPNAKIAMLLMCGSLWANHEEIIVADRNNIDLKTLGIVSKVSRDLRSWLVF